MPKLVRGDKLSPKNRAHVLRAYVHRLTTENGYPDRNPIGATVPAISDEQWLREHAFYVNVTNGELSAKQKHAEPAFLLNTETHC